MAPTLRERVATQVVEPGIDHQTHSLSAMYVPIQVASTCIQEDHLRVLELRWPANPKIVRQGDVLDLQLRLENHGPERIEFFDGFLELFGRLIDENGSEVLTNGFRMGRKLPRIQYGLDPGESETAGVYVYVSPEDQRSLRVGKYTVVLPLGDARDERMNSVLTSAAVAPPSPLTVVVVSPEGH